MEAIQYDPVLIYQPLQLSKEIHARTDNGKEIITLKRAKGLAPISPDTTFIKDSVLDRLKHTDSSDFTCEFLILVTMYDEKSTQFSNTLGGIIDNLDTFLHAGVDLRKICCVFIVDGMKAFHKTLEAAGLFFKPFFSEDEIKKRFQVDDIRNCKIPDEKDYDEFAHCFMQTLTVLDNPDLSLNFILCVKQKNKRKLNTHLWFFGGFCEHIQPAYVMLLEVGTIPMSNSLFYLYEALATQPSLGGCCGELRPLDPPTWSLVIGAQVFEYKLMNIFEKSVESLTGYISVLPGSFSAYRWVALQGSPLWKDYFKSILYPEQMNAFNSNIYLAMDRILCFAVITKKRSKYLLRYVKDSVAETDVPETLNVLIVQRRRWINGSWFSTIDSMRKYPLIFYSGHSKCRKLLFGMQVVYYLLNVINSWFMVGSFYLFVSISIRSSFGVSSIVWSPGDVILQLYTFVLVIIAIMAFGVKPDRVQTYFGMISAIMAVFLVLAIFTTVYQMKLTTYPSWVVYAFAALIGCFVLGSLLHLSFISLLRYSVHYFIMYPTYINTLYIYAMCNIHDVTWGSRPDMLTADERKRADEFEAFRTKWVICWAMSNMGYITFIRGVNNGQDFYFVYAFMLISTLIYAVKFAGSLLFLFQECCCKKSLKGVDNLEEMLKNRNKAERRSKRKKEEGEHKKKMNTSRVAPSKNKSILKTHPDTEAEEVEGRNLKGKGIIPRQSTINTKSDEQSTRQKIPSPRKTQVKSILKKRSTYDEPEEISDEEGQIELIQDSENSDEVEEESGNENDDLSKQAEEIMMQLKIYAENNDEEDSGRDLLYQEVKTIHDQDDKDELFTRNARVKEESKFNQGNDIDDFLIDFNEEENNGPFFEKYQPEYEDIDAVNEIKRDSNMPSFDNDEEAKKVESFKEEKEEESFFTAEKLKNTRYKTGMSLKRLSTLTNIGIKRLREIEDGKNPEEDEIERIKTAFD